MSAPLKALIALALAALCLPSPASAQASASAYTSASRYDAMRRVTGTIAPDPDGAGALPFIAVRNSYDGAGRLIRVETGELAAWQSESVAPSAWTGFSVRRSVETAYDAMGRKLRDTLREGATGPVRGVTQYSYDGFGRLDCTAVRMNPAIFGSLPASACTPGTTGTQGPDRITRTLYDIAGQRLQLRQGVGFAEEGAEATWAYDANGQVTIMIDGNGNRATLQYDGHGRQSGWTFPSATRAPAFNDATPALALSTAGSVGALQETYEYDPNGNRRFLTKRDGSRIEYQYDALNRMTVKIVPSRTAGPQALTPAQVRDVYYGYDLRGLQTFARFDSASGEGLTNVYDGFGRLTSATSNMGGTARTLTSLYDADGNRTGLVHPDGQWFGMVYDGMDRPVFLHSNWTAGIAYAYRNAAGDIETSARNNVPVNYGYDGLQRPISLRHDPVDASPAIWTLTRNPAGGIASTTRSNDAYAWTGHYATARAYTTNGLNQYTAATPSSGPATAFGYDANGNLTSSGSSAYVYDIENRMVSSSNGAALTYDPLGRLWQVTLGASTTRFLYDGDAMVAEYNAAGTLQRRHAHWPGADVPMVSYTGTDLSQPTQLLADERGSIVTLASASGGLAGINTYDEYGIPGAGNSGRFQYTGQIWLAELGMYYYKARIYSPTLGRFMQTDPVGYADQFNLYVYVGNDPVNLTDPSGLQVEPLCPGTDPLCTNTEAVTAPLSIAEQSEQERLEGRDQASGTLLEVGASAVGNAIYDFLSDIAPTDALENGATNVEIGAAGQAAVAEALTSNGYTVTASQVYIQTAAGMRVADHLVSDNQGGHVLVEVKANSATRSFQQARKDHLISQHGGIVRSRSSALPYGTRVTLPTLVINVLVPR